MKRIWFTLVLVSGVLAAVTAVPAATCITRDARYWFTHPDGPTTNCVTLVAAIKANGGTLDLGFITLPTTYRNNDNDLNEVDAMIEALGFYWRSQKRTGDTDGRQSLQLGASPLCRERKRLAVELIAATANVALLGADPSLCVSNFPATLLDSARSVAAGEDIEAIQIMRATLAEFNRSGVLNDFADPWQECSPFKTSQLKDISRDATAYLTCPGQNTGCATASSVIFPSVSDPYKPPSYKAQVSMLELCTGQAFWKISPPVAAAGRRFTVDASKCNFSPDLAIFNGICSLILTNSSGTSTNISGGSTNNLAITDPACFTTDETTLDPVVVLDLTEMPGQTIFQFVTDGSSTYFIRLGGTGKAKVKITSP